MIGSRSSVALTAAILPAPLAHMRQATARGTVLAVFERSAYLDLDGRIVALASAELVRGPLTITLREPGALPAIEVGAPVSLNDGDLRVGAIVVDLHDAAVWDPTLPAVKLAAARPAAASREAAIQEILISAPNGSIAPLLAAAPPIGPLLAPLARGLSAIDGLLTGREDSATVLPMIAQEIAGRGPGLTPSGDDLLVGIVLALWLWPRLAGAIDAATARDDFVDAARPRTTRISAAYLEAARRGQAAEPWHALVWSLSRSAVETRAAVRRLLQIGETSGADTLTGFCWVWRRMY